jgi:protein-disulfide isomerase
MKQLILIVVVIVGIIGAAVVFSGGEEQASGAPSNNFYGQEAGVITVTEFADFQCPACASFFPVISEVKQIFASQVRFEFKHFPLVQIHPNATAAHRAAQTAANQGKFWEMHDILFERLQTWNTANNPADIFEQYAQELGLDMDKYRAEIATSEILGVINADIEIGKGLSVTGTPTFFIDGERIDDLTSVASVESFSSLIQQKINEKTGGPTGDQGTAPLPTDGAPELPATRPEDIPTE